VSHSISPAIHRAAFAALGLPHTYEALDLGSDEELVAAMQALRRGDLAGANVTAPHKQRALDRADVVAPSAGGVGAANVLCRELGAAPEQDARSASITAHNTDVGALADELTAAFEDRPASTALVLGAGGAALAAVVALKRLGVSAVAVTTRSFSSQSAAETLPTALRFRELGAVPLPFPTGASADFNAWLQKTDVLVQATSAGTRSAESPASGEALAALIPWQELPSSAIAFDLVYNPRVTPFLRGAERRGLKTVGGLGMLVRQAALSLELWIGLTPPLDVLFAAASEGLA
jgi:shikimate dehydrogenase